MDSLEQRNQGCEGPPHRAASPRRPEEITRNAFRRAARKGENYGTVIKSALTSSAIDLWHSSDESVGLGHQS